MSRTNPGDTDDKDPRRAYNALTTLLSNGQPRKKIKRSVEDEPIAQPAAGTDGHVEGYEELADAEPEAGASESDSEEIQAVDDNEGDAGDPFEWHFASADLTDVETPTKWSDKKDPLEALGERSLLQYPVPPVTLGNTGNTRIKSLSALKLKYRLIKPFESVNPHLDELQKELAAPLFMYQDVLVTNRTWANAGSIQNMYTLHLLNHIYKTRDRVLKNNQKLSQSAELEFKDQGFTRPKVLVLLPTRNSACRLIETLQKICGLSQCENKKRFTDAFKSTSDKMINKPDDFQQMFEGNTNDLFCLGVKFTRQALKLYTSFYSSDLIVASPLGLRMIVGSEKDKKRDYDFLSSIELVIADQLEAMYMQSWENVYHVLTHLNLMPKESHGCDFARIRTWSLDQKAKLLRQTVLVTEYPTPEMYNLFARQCLNVGGKLKCRQLYAGVMSQLGIKIRQVFTRLPCESYQQEANQRFHNFTTVVLPRLLRSSSHEGSLVVIPSYFDFVRVRNYMEKKNLSYVSISEYSSQSQVSRGRKYFVDRKAKIMLYTQRLHHFRRYSIKGVHTVIFYSLPDNPLFYQEIVRFLARTVLEQNVDPDMLRVQAVYTKFDSLKLERIVGTKRVGPLVEGVNGVYEFI